MMTSVEGGQPTTPASTDAVRWWALARDKAVERLGADAEHGLAEAAVVERRNRYGRNELTEEPPIPLWRKVVDHVNELFVWILVVAAGISAVVGDWIDMAAILAIVLLNVAIGVFQEERASRALAALRHLSSPVVKVVRQAALRSIDAREIVPGDIVQLEAGDNIPADLRLLETYGFRTQEAALTGESVPIDKDAGSVCPEDAQLGDRANMAFLGTAVAAGRATAVVAATGMDTELGHIAGMLQRYEPEPTPLQRRLAALGEILIVVCLVVVGLVFALHMYRGGEFLEVLLLSISLAVAAVPEGMPAVVTITLAAGLQRMVKRNALIRRLPSVETLGSVTVICTDKTGTLTHNEMTVREVLAGDTRYAVTGIGYEPTGEFRLPGSHEDAGAHVIDTAEHEDLQQALAVGVLCNDSSLQEPAEGEENWSIVGDPTEASLLVAARKAGVERGDQYRRLHELPFDSERKAMSVIIAAGDDRPTMYTKGAPEVLLAKCTSIRRAGQVETLTDELREKIRNVGADMASRALRVLALAYREVDPDGNGRYEESDLVFAGLAGMIDPPRAEVIEAVKQCRQAGIRPVMITGDHPATALAIGREIGIVSEDARLVTGAELDDMTDEQLDREVTNIRVYARVSAKHKYRVVEAWQRNEAVVAMTGDGVNDAPAVKSADIGIAMGITGTDVTKETADMVLTDDNFASIVSAVEEGRGIFDNIQKFVHYLLSCNASEVLLMLFAGIAGWPPPLSALQILWINLVTDGLPALALGFESPEKDVMQRAPRPKREPVIDWARGLQMLWHGLLMAVVATAAFWWIYRGDEQRLLLAQSSAFSIMAFTQLFFALSCRSLRYALPEVGPFSNVYLVAAIVVSGGIQLLVMATPATQSLFELDPAIFSQWRVILMASLTPVTLVELTKLLRRMLRGGRRGGVDAVRPSPTR